MAPRICVCGGGGGGGGGGQYRVQGLHRDYSEGHVQGMISGAGLGPRTAQRLQ